FFSSRRRHTRFSRDWSSDVCSSDLSDEAVAQRACMPLPHEEVEQALILFTELFGLLGEGCPGGVHYAQVRPHEVHKPDVALIQHRDLGVKQRLPVQALSLPPSGCVMYILAH